jgi:hypothetical protein
MDKIENKMSYILRDGVLNDDTLHITNAGYSFKGGYVACIEYYTFLNEWANKKHLKYFRNLITLEKYIAKRYPDADIEIYQYNENL